MKKLAVFALAMFATSAFAERDIATTYQTTCSICHAAGAAGAPMTGDKAAWDARMANGMDALVASVENGKGAMMPKGMCMDCSKEDFKALIRIGGQENSQSMPGLHGLKEGSDEIGFPDRCRLDPDIRPGQARMESPAAIATGQAPVQTEQGNTKFPHLIVYLQGCFDHLSLLSDPLVEAMRCSII